MKYLGHRTINMKEFYCAVYCCFCAPSMVSLVTCSSAHQNLVSIKVIIAAGERHDVAPGAKIALAFYQRRMKQ